MATIPLNATDLKQRISELEASRIINPYSGNPTTITALAALLNMIEGSSGAAAGGGLTSQGVANGIDASLDIESIKNDIASIKTNTSKISQYSFQLAQDTEGTLCLIKTDTATGASSVINVATGLVFVPVGKLELTDPNTNQISVEQNEYDVIATNPGSWVIGDNIERIRTINNTTGAVLTTNWYGSTGVLLPTAPIINVDVLDSDRQLLTTAKAINNKLPSLGQALAAASMPVVLTSAQITALTPATNDQGGGVASSTTLRVVVASDDTQFGNKSTAATLPAGGIGLLGWISDIYRIIAGVLPTSLGTKIAANSFPVTIASNDIVAIKTDQTTHGTTDRVAADLYQIGGAAIATGLGAASASSQRVAVANDSKLIPWDGTNAVSIKAATTNSVGADTALVVAIRPLVVSQVGQVNPSADTALTSNARIKGLVFTNTSAVAVFLGVYASATALTAASVPSNGYVIRVPAGATLDKTAADFGEAGRLFGSSTRIGLSTTLGTFTALSAANLALCSLNLEIV